MVGTRQGRVQLREGERVKVRCQESLTIHYKLHASSYPNPDLV